MPKAGKNHFKPIDLFLNFLVLWTGPYWFKSQFLAKPIRPEGLDMIWKPYIPHLGIA